MLDRLALNPHRVDGIAAGLRQVAGLPDPIGEVLRGSTLPNGLQLRQQRVPLGVVGIVYEGRPNVTVDAFGLTLKSGNAVLLRGSSSAANSNAELVRVLRGALCGEDLHEDIVQLLPSADRSSVTHLIQARGLVDVVIPRGGAGLIDAVVRDATVPTIETGVGNCHVYVDAAADLEIPELGAPPAHGAECPEEAGGDAWTNAGEWDDGGAPSTSGTSEGSDLSTPNLDEGRDRA